jgi:hypothetical protein
LANFLIKDSETNETDDIYNTKESGRQRDFLYLHQAEAKSTISVQDFQEKTGEKGL